MDWLTSTEGLPRWLDLLSIVGTVVAAALAVVAITASKNATTRNAMMIARERQLDFELEMLVDIGEAIFVGGRAMGYRREEDLVLKLPIFDNAELPLCWHYAGLSSPAGAAIERTIFEKYPGDDDEGTRRTEKMDRMRQEIAAAMRTRLRERHET